MNRAILMPNKIALPQRVAATTVNRPNLHHNRHINSFHTLQKERHLRPLVVCAAIGDDDDDGNDPEWLRNLRQMAEEDPELAALLASANGGDADSVEAKMRSEMDALHSRITGKSGSGEELPPEVSFRAIDPFNLWVWLELYTPPTGAELEIIQEVMNSWFMLGRLGAYNSGNLQVLYSGSGAEGMEYEPTEVGEALAATMHDMGEVETNGSWVRFWVDMGTSDELALDILINAVMTLSKEHVGVQQIVFGGQNDDWKVPERVLPQVSMDPMRM